MHEETIFILYCIQHHPVGNWKMLLEIGANHFFFCEVILFDLFLVVTTRVVCFSMELWQL
jgi:hypothetical protein